jgi:hypothetical protein
MFLVKVKGISKGTKNHPVWSFKAVHAGVNMLFKVISHLKRYSF